MVDGVAEVVEDGVACDAEEFGDGERGAPPMPPRTCSWGWRSSWWPPPPLAGRWCIDTSAAIPLGQVPTREATACS